MKAKEYTLQVSKRNSFNEVLIVTSNDAVGYARNFYHDDIEIYESFFLILLNRAGKTIGYVKISQGGVVGTVVDVVLIAKYAIDSLAKSVILVHNHPSGNTRPSNQDIELTNKIKKALSLFDISILDHIILTKESYYSFADESIL